MSSIEEQIAKANAEREALRDAAFQTTPEGPPSKTAETFGAIYFRGVMGEPDRPKRWVEMANKVLGDVDDPHMGFQLQQCARFLACSL